MSEKPHDSPQPLKAAITKPGAGDSFASKLELVRAQRGMMWLLAAKFGMDFTVNLAGEFFAGPALIVFYCAFIVLEVAMAYFVFRVANVIYGIGPAIVCAGLALPPCLGGMTVLVLNGTTMDRLRKGGVKVGFMGATKSQLWELEGSAERT